MTKAEELAVFVSSAAFEDFTADTLERLKIHLLDSLGVAFGALSAGPIRAIREQLDDFGGKPISTLIGGGRSAPDRAAFYNGALTRYLDFMDSFIAPGETFHPSDNIGAVLAAAEYADSSGKEFLTALAVAYEVQARLSVAAPLRAKGFDHTTQGAYAAASGVAKALKLDAARTANAIAMSGTANNALRVTRTGSLSHWKGLAYPNTAFSATHVAFLAMRGITGPLEVFEGNKGFQQSVAGPFSVDWGFRGFNSITHAVLKKYDAEVHSQSAIEGVLELQMQNGFSGAEVESVDVQTFQTAFDIIGGGEEGPKTRIRTKEEADHSLPYLIAVALLDGNVYPEQFEPRRIISSDVQGLLRRVRVSPRKGLSSRFPDEMPTRIEIRLRDGRRYEIEKSDYEGFHTRPMSWKAVSTKFRKLSASYLDRAQMEAVEDAIRGLDEAPIRELASLLDLKRRAA